MQASHSGQDPRDGAKVQPEAEKASFRTLVVDGGHFMSAAVEEALKAGGRQILTADSAEQALDLTRQFQPDLILLDAAAEGPRNLELLGELLIEQAKAAVVVVARSPSIAGAVEAM